MTKRKKMTIEELNENYYIEVTVLASQKAEVKPTSYIFLDYSPVDTVHETFEYTLYDNKNNEIVSFEGENEEGFIHKILEIFDIPELENKLHIFLGLDTFS